MNVGWGSCRQEVPRKHCVLLCGSGSSCLQLGGATRLRRCTQRPAGWSSHAVMLYPKADSPRVDGWGQRSAIARQRAEFRGSGLKSGDRELIPTGRLLFEFIRRRNQPGRARNDAADALNFLAANATAPAASEFFRQRTRFRRRRPHSVQRRVKFPASVRNPSADILNFPADLLNRRAGARNFSAGVLNFLAAHAIRSPTS